MELVCHSLGKTIPVAPASSRGGRKYKPSHTSESQRGRYLVNSTNGFHTTALPRRLPSPSSPPLPSSAFLSVPFSLLLISPLPSLPASLSPSLPSFPPSFLFYCFEKKCSIIFEAKQNLISVTHGCGGHVRHATHPCSRPPSLRKVFLVRVKWNDTWTE